MPAEASINKIVLRLPDQGLRWIVNFGDLPIYACGSKNFTMRVPFKDSYLDLGTTNAYDFGGPLIVFAQTTILTVVNSDEGTRLTAYKPANRLSENELQLLKSYMRSIMNSIERDHTDLKLTELQI